MPRGPVSNILGGARRTLCAFERSEIAIEPITLEQARMEREAYREFGKGRHRVGLNFGDCLAYALARVLDQPLLYKGRDFSRTDLQSALKL